jgi:hypothetical protein
MNDPSQKIDPYLRGITRAFRTAGGKREAHSACHDILREMSDDPPLLTAILQKHLETPGALNARNYPVVALDIALNPYYGLVANCWIPLPGRETHISTKSIHHHGEMMLTTVTAFGPGYEHWMFTLPEVIDATRELYSTRLIERAAHPHRHVSFVDAQVAHLPMFPPSLSITYALWSDRKPTTWVDHLKRFPLVRKNHRLFRTLVVRAGLARSLDVKQISYFDYYPVEDGFRGMKDRVEFGLGPNADHLQSLFHVIQVTGNERLAPVIRGRMEAEAALENRPLIGRLVDDLEQGRPIEGRLSEGHTGVPHANYTLKDIERALAAVGGDREPHATLADSAPGSHHS